MAITNSLPAYVQEQNAALLRKAILGSKSAKLFSLQTGCKLKAAINLLSTAVTLQDGSACGWNEAGSSTLSQRIITAKLLKVNQSFCDKTLLNSCMQHEVRVAAGQAKLPFETDFINGVLEDVDNKVEKLVWQGDTTSTDTLLKLNDGLLKILYATTGGVPTANKLTYAADLSTSNVKAAIDAVLMAIPDEIIDKAVIFVGYDTYRKFVMALQTLNWYHYAGDGVDNGEINYPGSNVKIIAVSGLNGTGAIVAGDPKNFYYGVDMAGDEEKFDFWYSQDNQEFRLAVQFATGVQVAFPDQVIVSKKAVAAAG